MSDMLTVIGPALFNGGQPAEYAVEVLKNGGFGTRHLATRKMVQHVLSKVTPEALQTIASSGAPGNLAQLAGGTATTALRAAQPWLAAANLGVGLLNLGVSAWTAWKVHKMDRKLDGIADGLDRVEGKLDNVSHLLGDSVLHLDRLIRGNSMLLGVIIEQQGQLGHHVALLREEVARGFRSVNEVLTSAEARREAQELEQQMRSLFRYYELCTQEMRAGQEPPAADVRRVIDVATTLIAWLDTRMAAIPVGRPERLPLLVSRAFALRLEVDARNQLDEAPDGRRGEFSLLRGAIRKELEALIEGATVYALAEERRELVEQYVFLNRAHSGSATMVEFSDGSMVPYYPQNALSWDDGLERVRHAAQLRDAEPVLARIELKTLGEHQSLQRLVGLPRGATEDDVGRDVIVRALGLPQDTEVSESGLRELLRLGPSAAADTMARIKSEIE